jgi:hypothetical protein
MKIQPSLSVNALSGRNSGGVHLKNGYARAQAKPRNRRTNAQQSIRATFTTSTKAWGSLTDAQRTGWNNGAVNFPYSDIFGQRKIYSGKALYTKLNNNTLANGGSAISTCPSPSTVTGPTSISIGTNTISALTLVFAASPIAANTAFVVLATPPLSVGNSFPSTSKYRKITTLAAAATTPGNIFSAYQSVNGTPVVGKKIFFRVFAVNLTTGQVTPALSVVSTTA